MFKKKKIKEKRYKKIFQNLKTEFYYFRPTETLCDFRIGPEKTLGCRSGILRNTTLFPVTNSKRLNLAEVNVYYFCKVIVGHFNFFLRETLLNQIYTVKF